MKMNHDFKIANCDTDSIMFCKSDMTPFSEEEQQNLIDEINGLLPDKIKFAHDGYFLDVLICKAKNYALNDGKKLKIKGSALVASQKEKALKKFIDEVINLLLKDQGDSVLPLYNEYVKLIFNIEDISQWCSKKSITKKVLNPERTNEQKVFNAIEGSEYKEGDKIYVYYTPDGALKLQENYIKDHDPQVFLKKLFKTIEIFKNVLNISPFLNYSLVKNMNIAREIAGLAPIIKEKKSKKKLENS